MGKIRFIHSTIITILLLVPCFPVMHGNPMRTTMRPDASSELSEMADFMSQNQAQNNPLPTGEPGYCEQTGALNGKPLFIGYIPDYRTLEPEWGNCLTDIIYSAVDFFPDGSLDLDHINFGNLAAMQEIKEKYGTRIHFSIGGMNRSQNFISVTTNEYLRSQFVDNLQHFANQHQIDGIDLDWEFPETEQEISGYIALMNALQAKGFIVSVALYPYPDFDIRPYLSADRILLMSYDRGKQHATYKQAIDDLTYFSSLGVPKEKLYLGIPMYGRKMESPYQYATYSDIVEQYGPLADYVNVVDGIYFNNVYIVKRKTCYAVKNAYGGVMIWELGQDNGTLVKTINQAIVSGCQ